MSMDIGEPASLEPFEVDGRYSYRRFTSRREFRSAVVELIIRAAEAPSLEMTWCDSNFAQWPLGDPVLLAALVRWGLPRRKLTLLAHGFEEVPRLHPAFTRWRQRWSHVVECRALCDVAPTAIQTLIWVRSAASLKVVDPSHFIGVVSTIPADISEVRETIEAVSQRSQPAFASTVLGL